MKSRRRMGAGEGPSRRGLLIGATLVGGSLLVGGVGRAAGAPQKVGAFGPFIKISPDNAVTVVCKHSELGQGAQTGMAAMVAEELDADWSSLRVETAPADVAVYRHAAVALQLTGGSSSISNSWVQLRTAGAAARAMFVEAAARRWGAPAAEIDVSRGVVSHAKSGRKAGFGELLAAAAAVPPPAEPRLKTPAEFKIIGSQNLTRLDARPKSVGAAIFTQDVELPDQLTAVVAHSPRFGGKVKSFDATAARKVSGVADVFQIPSGVAVVASSTWAALKARDALKVEWDDSAAEMRSSAQILDDYRAATEGKTPAEWLQFEGRGDVQAAFAGPGEMFAASYDFPYLAHAAMEPLNCVAQVDGQRVRLTFGAQAQTFDQINVAALVGGKPDQVEIVTLPAGGSFGRRSVPVSDYQKECVAIAQKIGGFRPVKLVWTREDDFRGGYYRPATHHKIEVKLDGQGYPVAWRHRLASASILAGTLVQGVFGGKIEPATVEGVQGSPYLVATPAVEAHVHYPASPVTVCWLRAVGATHTAMAMEHTIDQLARRAKIDPAEYRRTLYKRARAERHLQTMDLALARSGWGTPLADGWTRGLAVHESFGSVVAVVV
ncbi:MAG TPA: molybdopterin cofactor-binding domain-containing protein, partial [Phenylobacterium sp.]|nr:molybdopterin cofactor-binding domain-containing protein [Phenylobacterium sp.]